MRGKKIVLALTLIASMPFQVMAEEPKKIQDNSFLLEEAYNQEAGVVQHIQTFMYLKESKDWIYTFTQEWPVPNETHQLSYTIPVVHVSDPANASGIGDIALNYRYQAVLKDHIALSPRFSVILPTGDYKKGHGTDSVGLQANIPLSVELSDKFVTHWNLGATYTPRSRESGGAKADTTSFNYGASLIYLATENFNLMLEAAGTSGESVQPDGSKQQANTFFINPGVRFAINFKSGLQIVPGVSMPIGVGPSRGELGGLAYLSFEHPLF
ncbi:MAG: transporter [Desulfuromonadales bacterium]|nr:transporter [Desulfuromonadales bacterium]